METNQDKREPEKGTDDHFPKQSISHCLSGIENYVSWLSFDSREIEVNGCGDVCYICFQAP